MVGTIVPVGNGQAISHSQYWVIYWYLLGSLLGGALTGGTVIYLGTRIQQSAFFQQNSRLILIFLGGVLILASAREAGLLSFAVPQSSWQVPRSWLVTFGHQGASFLFGTVLGASVFTPVVNISFYALILWILLVATPVQGAILILAYVIGRITPILVVSFVAIRSGHNSAWYMDRLDPLRSLLLVPNAMLLSGLGTALMISHFLR